MLVHLVELAMAPVALDQLALTLDLLGLGVGLLHRARVTFFALAPVRAVVATERRQVAIPQLPDPCHGRVQERPVVRGDQQ